MTMKDKFFTALVKAGFKPREDFILDQFMRGLDNLDFYFPKKKIAVEVVGAHSPTSEYHREDALKQMLNKHSSTDTYYDELIFLTDDIEGCIKKIKKKK